MTSAGTASSIHQYFSDKQDLWRPFAFSTRQNLKVSEVWQNCDDGGLPSTSHQLVTGEGLQQWLENTSRSTFSIEDNNCGQRRCVLRVIWIEILLNHLLMDVDASLFRRVCLAFNQLLPFQYSRTQAAGIGFVTDKDTSRRAYFFCNHPKIAMTWAQEPDCGVTSVICVADAPKLQTMQDLLQCRFIQDLTHLEMTPGLVCAIMCSKDIDTVIEKAKANVREVEVRTGYHNWDNRSEKAAQGDLIDLSAKMSGGGGKAASSKRKLVVLEALNRFIVERCVASSVAGNEDLLSVVATLKQRATMQKIDVEYTQYRAQTQKEALVHLIAANEAVNARKVALDNCHIATSTQHDTQSMKTLALMTMLFVPGAFVSSLFSTPLFEWKEEDNAVGSNLKVWLWYLAISCPLLVLCFLILGLWMIRQALQRDLQRIREEHWGQTGSVGTNEIRDLVLKRAAIKS